MRASSESCWQNSLLIPLLSADACQRELHPFTILAKRCAGLILSCIGIKLTNHNNDYGFRVTSYDARSA